jgi:D-alanyl-D-alanine carboxypeptidase
MIAFSCEASAVPCEDSQTLWLVNRENILAENFRPSDIVKFSGMELRKPARDAYAEMLAAMEADGIFGLRLQSAYRNISYQRAIFDRHVKELAAKGKSHDDAREITARSIQIPGASEHHLGLALDVSVDGTLSESFSETPAGKWLEENCFKFGFIIRYPKEKSAVTKIIYEPWHLRYVGLPHALIMRDEGLTLEEYHDFLTQIAMYVVWCEDYYFLTMYCDFPPDENSGAYDISATGQNENAGYIVTLRKPQTSHAAGIKISLKCFCAKRSVIPAM